jgi:hypothetical protein
MDIQTTKERQQDIRYKTDRRQETGVDLTAFLRLDLVGGLVSLVDETLCKELLDVASSPDVMQCRVGSAHKALSEGTQSYLHHRAVVQHLHPRDSRRHSIYMVSGRQMRKCAIVWMR